MINWYEPFLETIFIITVPNKPFTCSAVSTEKRKENKGGVGGDGVCVKNTKKE